MYCSLCIITNEPHKHLWTEAVALAVDEEVAASVATTEDDDYASDDIPPPGINVSELEEAEAVGEKIAGEDETTACETELVDSVTAAEVDMPSVTLLVLGVERAAVSLPIGPTTRNIAVITVTVAPAPSICVAEEKHWL
ncbi:hypothetical protein D9757_013384 [Collybiopsis confluens]|uniref:Uncharacterized protein n=1 Tax=Collybiopsis confluens TaxID=2823264 RepID=A0A8H5CPR2_9AGAR|nr:hypothetical protein D9757_013384 [Collybiopsis confluens]